MQNATSTKTNLNRVHTIITVQECLKMRSHFNMEFFKQNLQEQSCFRYATHIMGIYTKHRDLLRSEIVH